MIITIIFMVAVVVFVFLFVPFISWLTHRDMTMSRSNQHKKSNFKAFKKVFIECDMKPMKSFEGSWENVYNDSYYHASIIKFKGMGLVMKNPIEYIKVLMFMKVLNKRIENGNEPEWYSN